MCRLIGIEGYLNIEQEIRKQILSEFFDLAEHGCVPKGIEKGHNDGYGIVGYKQGVIALYYRSNKSPQEDKNYGKVLESIVGMDLDLAIGHLRKATKGGNAIENNQPLINDRFAFATNGTIHFPELNDSENDSRLFFQKLTKNSDINAVLQNIEKLDYTSATLLFSDGKKISAARWYNANNARAKDMDFNAYYTLFESRGSGFRIFSSQITSAFSLLNIQSELLQNYSIVT